MVVIFMWKNEGCTIGIKEGKSSNSLFGIVIEIYVWAVSLFFKFENTHKKFLYGDLYVKLF